MGCPGTAHSRLPVQGTAPRIALTYQEGTEHVEADEVEDSKAAATGCLPFCAVAGLGLRSTLLARHAGQHDVLPGLPCGTPGAEKQETHAPLQPASHG